MEASIANFEEALETFNRVIEIEPDLEQVISYKTIALHDLERYDEALIELNKL